MSRAARGLVPLCLALALPAAADSAPPKPAR
ncbi:MAG: hypothetical protein RL071_807, partial [Pseudomonadota bacterium]